MKTNKYLKSRMGPTPAFNFGTIQDFITELATNQVPNNDKQRNVNRI